MKGETRNRKKLHKSTFRVILGFVVSLVLLCFATGMLVAKYYAGRSDKGVAVASGLYFTSNVLRNVGDKTDDELTVIYNTATWDGTTPCELGVMIRNFQTQLLYNDKDLDVTYQITFQLMGETDGGEYKVTYKDEATNTSKTVPITSAPVTISDMKLPGGAANYDQFTVQVSRPESKRDDVNYTSVGIKVIATPTSPSFSSNLGTLGGVLYATMVSTQYSLIHHFDAVTAPLDEYSGFLYTITYMPGENNVEHTVTLSWDKELEIDQFNAYYQQAKANGSLSQDADGKKQIQMTIQPYSSIQIAFYRGAGFAALSKADLENYVNVKDNSLEGN